MIIEPNDDDLLRIMAEEEQRCQPVDNQADGGAYDPDVAHSGRYSG